MELDMVQYQRLWNEKDVRKYAGFKSRNTLYTAIREGLPVIRQGRLLRFSPQSVIEFFKNKEEVI